MGLAEADIRESEKTKAEKLFSRYRDTFANLPCFFKPSKRQRGRTEKNAKNQKPADKETVANIHQLLIN